MPSSNPFSEEFQRKFDELTRTVELLESRIGESQRSFGQLFDRVGGGDATNQFILFCYIASGSLNNPDAPEDDDSGTYVLVPAFDFYGSLFEPGEAEGAPFDKMMKRIGVPKFVLDQFEDGRTTARNICDTNYKEATTGNKDVVRNLHGVAAPNNPDDTNIPGNVAILPLAVRNPGGGIGGVPVIFTRGEFGRVHIGLYGKNDLQVSCSQTIDPEGMARQMQKANKRWRDLARRAR
mgnify:CR=1 FL=1|jgi:hypothetical protein